MGTAKGNGNGNGQGRRQGGEDQDWPQTVDEVVDLLEGGALGAGQAADTRDVQK